MAGPIQPTVPALRPSHARHWVLSLAIIVYMITYMDRVCIGHAAPAIREEFGFSRETMGWIFFAFNCSYALFQIPGGWLGDRFGPRRILSIIVLWWSAFTAATALAWSWLSMFFFRFFFGLGEAGAFPTATRALSLWLPASERGFAQGITHSGARLGAAITPPMVVFLMTTFGWRSVFYIFGLVGMLWAITWYIFYRDRPEEHRLVNAAELAVIHRASDERPATGAASAVRRTAGAAGKVRVPWRRMLSSPNLWLICGMYFCYAYSIWIYLSWFPTYLIEARGFSLKEMGFWHMVALSAATVGDSLGGWFSDRVARRTGNLRLARRSVAIFGFTLAMACILPATFTADRYVSVAFTTLALFGLELTVGVSWAVAMDVGPEFAGSISGVMNMCGNLGGALASPAVAYLVKWYNWQVPFLAASGFCLLAAISYLRIDPNDRIFPEDSAPAEVRHAN